MPALLVVERRLQQRRRLARVHRPVAEVQLGHGPPHFRAEPGRSYPHRGHPLTSRRGSEATRPLLVAALRAA
ncbi:hypothetical protein ACFPRL_12405 [Pseudoclavibacter helvolus]